MTDKSGIKYWINLFYYAVKWNALESIVYHFIYTIHHLILFQLITPRNYAQIGLLFSLLYFFIPLINSGLDKTFVTYFNIISHDKYNFKRVVFYQFGIQGLVITISIFGFVISNYYFFYLPFSLVVLISTAFAIESLKKSFKVLAQLYFLNNITALLEIFSIIAYVTGFWLLWYFYQQLSPAQAIIPLIIESVIVTTILAGIVVYHYKKIETNTTGRLPWRQILTNRFFIALNQLSTLLFSTNLLLAFFSYKFGLEKTAIMHLAKSVVAFLMLFFEKTFGITSGTLFSRVTDDKPDIKQAIFNQASSPIYKTVFSSIIILAILFISYTFYYGLCYSVTITNSFLFVIAILIAALFIPQEQFLLVEKKIIYLCLMNLGTAFIFYPVTFLYLDFTGALLFYGTTRFVSLVGIDKLIERKIGVKIKYHVYTIVPWFIIFVLVTIFSLIFWHYCR